MPSDQAPSVRGQFVWYELMSDNAAAAQAFYGAVIGWSARDAGGPNAGYTIFSAGETMAAGMMESSAKAREAGARPGWNGYIGTEDVDAAAARVAGAGGTVYVPPTDIPEVGRFAMVADPQRAVFALFTPRAGDGAAPPPGTTPGRIGWHELHADDGPAAFAFYAQEFGWTKTDAIDMGPMGIYQTFATGRANDGGMVGGIMTRSPQMPHAGWLYYFNVDDVDAAIGRVGAAGGTVTNGPIQVPGGSWIAHATDLDGAMFAMVGPRAGA